MSWNTSIPSKGESGISVATRSHENLNLCSTQVVGTKTAAWADVTVGQEADSAVSFMSSKECLLDDSLVYGGTNGLADCTGTNLE